MRSAITIALVWLSFPGLAILQAVPPPDQTANYNVTIQSVVDLANAFRATHNLPPLTPVPTFFRGSRELVEGVLFDGLEPVFDPGIYTAAGYSGSVLGVVNGDGYTSPTSFVANAQTATFDNSVTPILASPTATEIGVGIAVQANGPSSRLIWQVAVGAPSVNGVPSGLASIEADSGRGLPSASELGEIFGSTLTGDSRDGFIDAIPDGEAPSAAILAFQSALRRLLAKPPRIRAIPGKRLAFALPRELLALATKVTLRGRLPVGVRFNSRSGKFSGKPTAARKRTVRVSIQTAEAIPGFDPVPPIRIQFR